MNKHQALHLVASHVAGNLLAGSFEESTGLRDDDVDGPDYERLVWARDQVAEKLYSLGKP